MNKSSVQKLKSTINDIKAGDEILIGAFSPRDPNFKFIKVDIEYNRKIDYVGKND